MPQQPAFPGLLDAMKKNLTRWESFRAGWGRRAIAFGLRVCQQTVCDRELRFNAPGPRLI